MYARLDAAEKVLDQIEEKFHQKRRELEAQGFEAESSDEDILSAREQLKALKRMQKDLNKEAQLQKIAHETVNVRR